VLVIETPRHSTQRNGVLRGQRENLRANTGSTSSSMWADTMKLPKPELTFRYMFQNIQGLPVDPRGHKHQQIGLAFKETDADAFGMAKLNLNFPKLGPVSQWYERFRGLKRSHSIHATNIHDSTDSNILYGGTALTCMGSCSHQAISSGKDESGLGRWVWTLFAGRNQTQLRIISGYRPNPDSSDKTGSVYSQHERYLRSKNDNRNPRRAFVSDLKDALEKWKKRRKSIYHRDGCQR